jgi:hypothetical protein
MNLDQFKHEVGKNLHVGMVLKNPGNGTSKITSLSERGISYIRGQNKIYVPFQDLFDTLNYFKGETVTSSDLKTYRPSVFDSKAMKPGHSCNCTFFFLVLIQLGIASNINGRGVRGNPFFVSIPNISGKGEV